MSDLPAGTATPVFALASYNIHRCFGTDRKYQPERTVQALRSLEADVIALQEVDMRLLADDRHQLEFLADSMGMGCIAGPNIQDHRGVFGNALLTRFPIERVRLLDLSVRRFEPRGAILAHLDIHGATVLVAATHLGLNAAERRLQVRALLRAIADEADGQPTIVMGDFNEWKPNHGALRSLNRRFGQSMMPRTFPSRFPVLPLDRLWVWPRAGLRQFAVFATPLTRVASDHLPIRGEVAWSRDDLGRARKDALAIAHG